MVSTSVALDASHDDRALVARLLAHDERAFASLVDSLHGSLVRLAQVFVADRAIAEEVTQETWTAVLSGLASFEQRSALRTWIFRILTNRAKTRGMREARSVAFSSLESEGSSDASVDPSRFNEHGAWSGPPAQWDDDTPEKLLARKETLTLLDRAIDELPPAQRAVVVLRDLEGVDAAEACNILAISETNQRVLLHRGRSKLRAALEQHMAR